MGFLKDTLKTFMALFMGLYLFGITAVSMGGCDLLSQQEIKRLTFSKNNLVHYPSLSDDGLWMLYILEIKDGQDSAKALMVMNTEDGKEKELFRSGKHKAPAPFQDINLKVGSKPPVLSGNGQVAVLSLSLGEPVNILDHYMAIINTDGTNLRIISFPILSLEGKDLKSLDFTSNDWERVSNYTVSSEGNRVACVLKGHLGPRRYGHPSGIVFLDTLTGKQRTILAPDFDGREWNWSSRPHHPLTGGGWAFCMSSDGQKVVFGAQSSEDVNDFDLYNVNWDGNGMRRITDFHDRWFSLADMSHDGEKVAFFYTGRKKQGIGTYVCNNDGTGLAHLESTIAPRVELYDLTGNGQYILFKHIYTGMLWDLEKGREIVAFDERTPGYASELIPMDFPRMPAFWGPKIVSFGGEKILLFGHPQGKTTPDIFMLSIELRE